MTLHEAIEQLLRERGRPMTTNEIAMELNKNKWYQKKDGSKITAFQVHGRTKNYPQLFRRDGSTVSLNDESETKEVQIKKKNAKPEPDSSNTGNDFELTETALMNESNFIGADIVNGIILSDPGLYSIRIKEPKVLPAEFSGILHQRGHNIIYIGIATQNLNRRFLNQELRANGHGTFFRSIGAVLGYKPPKGSLKNKANKKNYKFSRDDESSIIDWINQNLIVNWIGFTGDFETIETILIRKYLPLLNLAKNPYPVKELQVLRAECVRIANS